MPSNSTSYKNAPKNDSLVSFIKHFFTLWLCCYINTHKAENAAHKIVIKPMTSIRTPLTVMNCFHQGVVATLLWAWCHLHVNFIESRGSWSECLLISAQLINVRHGFNNAVRSHRQELIYRRYWLPSPLREIWTKLYWINLRAISTTVAVLLPSVVTTEILQAYLGVACFIFALSMQMSGQGQLGTIWTVFILCFKSPSALCYA